MGNGTPDLSKTHPSLTNPNFHKTNNMENFKIIYNMLGIHDSKISSIKTDVAVIKTNICWIKKIGGSGSFLMISLLVAILTKLMFF